MGDYGQRLLTAEMVAEKGGVLPVCVECGREVTVGNILYNDNWDGECYCGHCLSEGGGVVYIRDLDGSEGGEFTPLMPVNWIPLGPPVCGGCGLPAVGDANIGRRCECAI